MHVSPRRLAVLLATTFGVSGLVPPAMAQAIAAPASQVFNLPAAPLSDTLSLISVQSGRPISASAELLAGKQSAAVRSAAGPEAAARQALSGTGLELVVTQSGVLTVRQVPAGGAVTAFAPIVVTGDLDTAPSEATGNYAVRASTSATRMNLSMRRTPQSVSVVTRQQMEDQGIVSMAEALQQTPGVSVMRENSEGYSFYARGFQLQNFQFDGMPSLSSDGGNIRDNYSITNSVIYDRVEVLKGATGLVNGAGYPSGVINFVRKRPTGTFQGQASAGVGSWDRYRSEVDLGGPFNESGSLRGRMVAATETHGSYMDHAKGREHVLYGIVEADLTSRTKASLGLDFQRNRNKGTTNSHLPAFFSDGRPVRFLRSTNPAAEWAWRNQDTTRLFADVSHQFDNGWQVKMAATHRNYASRELIAGMSSAFVDAQTHSIAHGFYPGGASRFDTDSRENSVDIQASGPYTLFGREHELVVGYNASRTHTKSNRSDGDTDALIPDAFNWNNDSTQPSAYEWWLSFDMPVTQKIWYAATILHPTDRLSLIGGGRISDYSWAQDGAFGNGRRTRYSTRVDSEFIPYAGITFDVDDRHTVYASYTDVFKPQAYNFDANNRQLDPLTGKSHEIGAKGEYLDGRVNASVALFRLKQDNVAEPDTSGAVLPGGGTPRKAAQGVTTRGIELEIAGEVSPGWQLQAGYTYSRSRDRDGERIGSTQGQQLFKLATSYRLPGQWHRLTVGGNLYWQSGAYFTQQVAGADRRFTQDSYAIVGLMAAYDIDRNLRVSVNLNNLFDKTYYSGLGNYNSVFYGNPRNVMAQVRYKF